MKRIDCKKEFNCLYSGSGTLTDKGKLCCYTPFPKQSFPKDCIDQEDGTFKCCLLCTSESCARVFKYPSNGLKVLIRLEQLKNEKCKK